MRRRTQSSPTNKALLAVGVIVALIILLGTAVRLTGTGSSSGSGSGSSGHVVLQHVDGLSNAQLPDQHVVVAVRPERRSHTAGGPRNAELLREVIERLDEKESIGKGELGEIQREILLAVEKDRKLSARALCELGDSLLLQFFENGERTSLRDQAFTAYGEAARRDPDLTEPKLKQSLCLLHDRKYTQAHGVLKRLLEAYPFNAKAHLYMGYAVEGLVGGEGKVKEATEWFERARTLGDRSDQWFMMPKGYQPYIASDYKHYHDLYMPALTSLVLYREINDWIDGVPHYFAQLHAGHETDAASLDGLIESYKNNEYIVVRGMMHKFEWAAVNKYYVDMMNTDALPTKEDFVEAAHNDRIGYWINWRLAPAISALAGQPLTISYSYYVNYLGKENNPGLKAHTDAVDNEYTVTWHISDKGRDANDEFKWKLYFDKESHEPMELGHWEKQKDPSDADVVEVVLDYGDFLCFRGRKHGHFRQPLEVGRESGNLLSHFISLDYPVFMARHEHNEKFKDE